jgi:hypothetical protein
MNTVQLQVVGVLPEYGIRLAGVRAGVGGTTLIVRDWLRKQDASFRVPSRGELTLMRCGECHNTRPLELSAGLDQALPSSDASVC